MNFEEMKALEPELARLETSAHVAGRHGAAWLDTIFATHEVLTKLVGRGAESEVLQSSQAYERARAALFAAWSRGAKSQADTVDVGGLPATTGKVRKAVERSPGPPGGDVQLVMFDVSEAYR